MNEIPGLILSATQDRGRNALDRLGLRDWVVISTDRQSRGFTFRQRIPILLGASLHEENPRKMEALVAAITPCFMGTPGPDFVTLGIG